MSEYTPTTEQVRMDYIQAAEGDRVFPEVAGPQFDRWLASVETAAEQRGAAQGWDQCRDSIISAGRDHTEYSSNALDPGLTLTAFLDYTEKALANPYRADQMEASSDRATATHAA